MRINVFSARPGIAIGKKGAGIEQLRGEVAKLLKKSPEEIYVNVTEVRKAEIDAQLIARHAIAAVKPAFSLRLLFVIKMGIYEAGFGKGKFFKCRFVVFDDTWA